MTKKQSIENFCGIRVKKETRTVLEKLIQLANKKTYGRRIKVDDVLHIALGLVEKDHIQGLQNASLSNEDKKERLRQIYVKKHGQISKDAFTGFMMSSNFSDFLEKHKVEAMDA